jgi:4-amino-4-deoxy-L-arabinose transferase-like glycosyltransferase
VGATVFVWVACCVWGLAAIGLVGPDEPRYAWIARAMAETGDWVTPRLYGAPWFEKPVLYYWFAAVGFRFLHSAEWAARLPSALAAVVTALAMGWCARRYFGRRAGFAALLIFPTTVATVSMARAATPDMLLACCVTLAMVCAVAVLELRGEIHGKRREGAEEAGASRANGLGLHGYLVLFGVFLGLGTLAKGPVAVVLAGGALLVWCAVSRRWASLLVFFRAESVLSFVAVAAPWYALCAMRNPGFLRAFLWQHNIERYATPVFRHVQPFWFFGPVLLLAMLPWSPLLLLLIPDLLRFFGRTAREAAHRPLGRSPGIFFACWAMFPVLFFSFSASKLPPYILPSIGPLCVVVAAVAERAIVGRSRQLRWILASIGFAAVALGVICLHSGMARIEALSGPGAGNSDWACVTAICGGVAVSTIALFRKLREALIATALATAVLALTASSTILPGIDAAISPRFAAGAVSGMNAEIFELNRSWEFGLEFYLRRPLAEWSEDQGGPATIITNAGNLPIARPHKMMLQIAPKVYVDEVE